jgi:tetratricopeptide (TPR) repeat protein
MRNAAPVREELERFLVEKTPESADYLALRKQDEERINRIKAILQLLEQSEKPQKFGLYLELAKLYRERHDFLRKVEINRYLVALDKQGDKAPPLSLKSSQAELLKSADVLRNFMRDFSSHPNSAEGSFQLARTLGRLANENADYYYKMALKKKPSEAMMAEMYAAQGDLLFDSKAYIKAIDLYKQAMKYKKESVYPYVVYKLGWAHYLMSINEKGKKADGANLSKALAALQLTVKLTDKQKEKGGYDLRSEALYDLAMLWAESDVTDVRAAQAYLTKSARPDLYAAYLERRARYMVSLKKYEAATDLYRQLIAGGKPGAQLIDYYGQILELHYLQNNSAAIIDGVKKMLAMRTAPGEWQKLLAEDKKQLDRLESIAKQATMAGAEKFHAEAEKQKSDDLLKIAQQFYQLYIESFPQDERLVDMRYNHALIMFHFGQFEKAAAEFTWVMQKSDKKPKLLADAAYNRVFALYELDKNVQYPNPSEGDKKLQKPVAIPPLKAKFIEAVDSYLPLADAEKRREMVGINFNNASFFMAYGHYEEAVKRFESIFMSYPKTQQGKASVGIVINFFVETKNFEEVVSRCAKFIESGKLRGTGLEPTLLSIMKDAKAEQEKAK